MAESKLKPCPFCGGEAERIVGHDLTDYIQCDKCGLILFWEGKAYEETDDAWNKRVTEKKI